MLDGVMARGFCLDRSGSPAPAPPLLAPASPVMARREITAMREVMELRTEVDGLRDLLAREAQQRTRCLKDLARNVSQIHTDAEDRQGEALQQVRQDFQDNLKELRSLLGQQQNELKGLCSALRGPLNSEVFEQRLQLIDERMQLLSGVHAPLERRVELLADLLEALQKRHEHADERHSSLEELLQNCLAEQQMSNSSLEQQRRSHSTLEQLHEQFKREQQGDMNMLVAHLKEEAVAHQNEARRCDEELSRLGQRVDDLTSLEQLFRQFEQRLETTTAKRGGQAAGRDARQSSLNELLSQMQDKRLEHLDVRLEELAKDVSSCGKGQRTAKNCMDQVEQRLAELKQQTADKFAQREGLARLDDRVGVVSEKLEMLIGKQALGMEQLYGMVEERLKSFTILTQAQDSSRENLEQRVQQITLIQNECMQRLQSIDASASGKDDLGRGSLSSSLRGEHFEILQEFRGKVADLERRFEAVAAAAAAGVKLNSSTTALLARDHEQLDALSKLERQLEEHISLYEQRHAKIDDLFLEITETFAEDLEELCAELNGSRSKLQAEARTGSPASSVSDQNTCRTRQSRIGSLSRRLSEAKNSVEHLVQQAIPAQDRSLLAVQARVGDLDKSHGDRINTLEQSLSFARARLVAVDDLDVRVRVLGEQLQTWRQAHATSMDELKHSMEDRLKRVSLTQEERHGLVDTTKEVLAWEQRFGSLVSFLRSEVARLEAGRAPATTKQETNETMSVLSARVDSLQDGLAKEGRVRDDAIRRLGEIIRQ